MKMRTTARTRIISMCRSELAGMAIAASAVEAVRRAAWPGNGEN